MTRPRWHSRAFNNGAIFGATFYGVSHLPRWLTYLIGRICMWFTFRFWRSGTDALRDNFHVVAPDLDRAGLDALVHRTLGSYAKDTIDFIRSLTMPTERLRATVRTLDVQAYYDALAGGAGAIAVSPHFGNWEIGGILIRRVTSYPLSVVVLREPDESVHQIRLRSRALDGIDTIEVRGGGLDTALRIRRSLQANHVVAFLIDRHIDKDRVPVTFFGRPAFFLRTPALIGYLSGAPLVPCFVIRTPDDRLDVVCGPIIHVSRAGDRDASVQRATQQVADVFEAKIRQHPHLWYQFYPYWQAQGDGGTGAPPPSVPAG